MARMSVLRVSVARGRLAPVIGRIPGGARYAPLVGVALAVFVAIVVGLAVTRGNRVAAWAPMSVISSHDPLQELPIRVAGKNGLVRPARTHDAILDLKSISTLVVGVNLDRIPTGAARYEAVIRTDAGQERFRSTIAPEYFTEGRFMLRLYSRRFPRGDYRLEIEAVQSETDKRVVAVSWFQVA
jgi:hypothetical protein